MGHSTEFFEIAAAKCVNFVTKAFSLIEFAV
jgi:hypothetical protein